jgi:serine/threonine-protein kinase
METPASAMPSRLGPPGSVHSGTGGMGDVYSARDTVLDRDVALKVLPRSLAADSERLARFQREAKVLASLNHPNIAQIYGVEQGALVIELVDGETLKSPLPISTALDYAGQIAAALEAAHEKGVVHRDLKPANVMTTPQGVVKVLDFGLAAVEHDLGHDAANVAAEAAGLANATRTGTIMGTAAYMSPEQAAGRPVDKRADIWAFGVVLWELLTDDRCSRPILSETLSNVSSAPIGYSGCRVRRRSGFAISGAMSRPRRQDPAQRHR